MRLVVRCVLPSSSPLKLLLSVDSGQSLPPVYLLIKAYLVLGLPTPAATQGYSASVKAISGCFELSKGQPCFIVELAGERNKSCLPVPNPPDGRARSSSLFIRPSTVLTLAPGSLPRGIYPLTTLTALSQLIQPGDRITLHACKTNKLQLRTVEQDHVVPVVMTSSQKNSSMLSVDASKRGQASCSLSSPLVGDTLPSYTGTVVSVCASRAVLLTSC